jgi:hypothetical protein
MVAGRRKEVDSLVDDGLRSAQRFVAEGFLGELSSD